MITLTAEQAQQIEEALVAMCNSLELPEDSVQALATIRAARAQEQAEQKPVAFIGQGLLPIVPEDLEKLRKHEPGMATLYDTPLYAAPVRTKDLTEAEIDEIWKKHSGGNLGFAYAVIAADREKNK